MFFFFSNRLGCFGSIFISLLLTVILIGIFRGGLRFVASSSSECLSFGMPIIQTAAFVENDGMTISEANTKVEFCRA
ncbi:hypothetical protein [Methylorubrum aminovorans]